MRLPIEIALLQFSRTVTESLMPVTSRYRLRSGTKRSLGGQRRIYKKRASWHDLPEHCAGSSTSIANSARLRQTCSPRRNSSTVIFLHQEGHLMQSSQEGSASSLARCVSALTNRPTRRGGSLIGDVAVENGKTWQNPLNLNRSSALTDANCW